MNNKEETKKKRDFVDKTIDFLFSKNETKWLIPILLIGVILRFIVARNISALGDEMVHGPHAIGFLHSGLLSTIAHSPPWFYLTDIAMRFLGVTMFSTRFLSFFYGSISIILIYLISSHIFNKKTGLISAFLFSLSFYIIRYTLMEMDLSAIFFLLLAVYSFMLAVEKQKFPYLAAISIGVASLIKTLSLFFVPAFVIGFFLFSKKEDTKEYAKKNIKNVLYFGLIITLLFSPILIHNYLWYMDKGMVDTYFAQYFDIGTVREAYSDQLGYDSGLLYKTLPSGIFNMLSTIFHYDPVIFILGILGLIFTFSLKEKRKYLWFLISFQLFGFVLLVLSNLLPTHYTTMMPVLCIFGAPFLIKLSSSFKQKISSKKLLTILLAIFFIFQIYLLLPHLTTRCALSQTREYAVMNMDKNSLVIADARIYRGRIAWLFNDFHYLESTYTDQIFSLNQNLSGNDVLTKVYFVECVVDDCGWGTITAGPLNDSSESIVQPFSSINPEKIILGGGGYDEETGKPYFKIYSTVIPLKPQILSIADSTHDWFYYPVNYLPKEKIFDNYQVNGTLDNLIYLIAWIITISSIVLAITFSIVPFFYLFRGKKNETSFN
ncbi:hypothetical protein COV15_02890 [Candidatus Woesearchaeota archaeon CG10_big_fil_rev_8_21_14_0_10_34_12]|nr:MAG: hypothetical protein COV15_02890 [Candidatus Woesearchaeota archaeon CG10_big_fil_rev_8_21_14_0_10_34_12]